MSSTLEPLLRAVDEAPEGPRICAIFDFDGTLISGYSAVAFLREQLRRGDVSRRELLELASAMASFGLGNMGFSAMMAVTSQFLKGIEEDSYVELGEDLFEKQIARLIYPEARALIAAHRAKGHTLAIISSATPYQVEPAAADLGIENVLCTQLEVEDGVFTGEVVHPTCFGQGKVDAAEVLADSVGANLGQSFFYSDSTDDQLLLERVGNPVALNPSEKLRALARDNAWPTASFGSRGRPTLGQFVRSIAATASLVPTFAAGLPIYALTGSRREATNFSISLFAETASALINLDLRVRGEENLWAQRPAVFIFNHQSKADVVIGAKLLRRDLAGVGKQEIKKMPLIGKVMELGGVVMIDRKNAASAIEAMQPLVEAMRNENKSVALAPEGTRSVSPLLGPFKKGAFHLAMQAGVPMVPVVIHNAGDVAPKGDFVFRPATVEVDVLPPVDTSDWSTATIDDHIRDVRNMFLRTLGQPEEESLTTSAPEFYDDDSQAAALNASESAFEDGKTQAAAKAAAPRKARSKKKAPARKKAPAKKAAQTQGKNPRRKTTPADATDGTAVKDKTDAAPAKAKSKAPSRRASAGKGSSAKGSSAKGSSAKGAAVNGPSRKAAPKAKRRSAAAPKAGTKTKARPKSKAVPKARPKSARA